MDKPVISYVPHRGATPEAESAALATCFHYILDCHAKKMVAEHATEPDSSDDHERLVNEQRRSS